MRRLAVLSLHTSPLAQPGTGDGGGMNVYVRELAAALARRGVACDVFTRAWSADLPSTVDIEPGLRVHHVPAGPLEPLPKEALPAVVDDFTARVLEMMGDLAAAGTGPAGAPGGPFTSIHANYWLSGLSGHVIKHELELPLVCTFHTLDRVKAEAMPEEVEADMPHRRAEAEASIIECSDAVLASCSVEAEQIASLYGGDPGRIRIVAPGVDHAFFGPGHRPQARRALGLPEDGRLLLFVGRIQPLKRADVAIETLAELRSAAHRSGARAGGGTVVGSDVDYRLVVVGGPSGPHGEKTLGALVDAADARGVRDRVHVVAPQPHELLSSYYRAADVCLVPSHSESFGLVALEAAACGTPVVASAVGGLTTLVDHERTGFLVDDPDPGAYAAAVRRVFDEPLVAERLSTASVLRARRYTWRAAASALVELHDELAASHLVECG
jgi:D-inositol-3-phosphate glycosyltransferase